MITDGVISLRAPEMSDVDVMYLWENDRKSWIDGRIRTPLSRQLLWDYVNNYNPDLFVAGQLRMMICVDGEAVGMVDLYDVDSMNRRAGVGIIIAPETRRKGYALRALNLLSDYSKRELGLHQLWAITIDENVASRELFHRALYSVSGRLRSWVRVGAQYHDAYISQRLLV